MLSEDDFYSFWDAELAFVSKLANELGEHDDYEREQIRKDKVRMKREYGKKHRPIKNWPCPNVYHITVCPSSYRKV